MKIDQQTAIKLNQLHLNNGFSLGEIGKFINPNYVNPEQVIRRAFNKYNLKYIKSYRRGGCLEPRFFKDIDNELKAYLLGFIYADGCIYKNSLQITSTDLEILDLIKNNISPSQNYHKCVVKEGQQFKLSLKIYNYFITEDLKRHGINYNKTYEFENADILNNLNEELKRHFIRGFFDGDGSIYSSKNYVRKFKLSNTNNFLLKSIEDIFTFLGTKYFYKESYEVNNKAINMNYWALSDKQSLKIIYRYLYDNCNYYLHRKRSKFEDIILSLK